METELTTRILASRKHLVQTLVPQSQRPADAAEGGCGVLGLTANRPVAGRHVMTASHQMHNRGNGKGGGIAMAGLDPKQMRVDAEVLQSHTLLQIALLDPAARPELESEFITPYFDVAQAYEIDHLDDYRQVEGLGRAPAGRGALLCAGQAGRARSLC